MPDPSPLPPLVFPILLALSGAKSTTEGDKNAGEGPILPMRRRARLSGS
jgi:hypothetical protein